MKLWSFITKDGVEKWAPAEWRAPGKGMHPSHPACCASAGPMANECLEFAHDFRLDERLTGSLVDVSLLASLLVAGPLAFVAAAGGGLHGLSEAARQPLAITMLAGVDLRACVVVFKNLGWAH